MTLDDAFLSLFEVNMGARCGETIIVFTDQPRPDESLPESERDRRERLFAVAEQAAAFAGRTYGNTRFVSFPATEASGAEPPRELWEAALGDKQVRNLESSGLLDRLLRKEATAEELATAKEQIASAGTAAHVIIALANNSTSHTNFRALCNAAGGRFASLPHFDPEMFFSSMSVDWAALARRTRTLAGVIAGATRVRVTAPNGTDVMLGKEGRPALGDDGLLSAPGSFGNLPAGEVFLAPLEGTTEGRLVIEYAPLGKLRTPLELEIRDGRVTGITGDDPFRKKLEARFGETPDNRNIAELGIGTNDRATRPDNILEAEKILGTIHIALGDNRGFGGTVSTPYHEDFVVFSPTVTAFFPDGSSSVVLHQGKLLLPEA